MRNHWMIGAAGAIVLATMSTAASATPLGSAAGSFAASHEGSLVEKAARRCWWENGYRRCARVRGYGYGGYGYTYGRPRPEELRTGSKRWWDSMDFEDRGGRGGR
jgi:hypothetical protein